MTCPNCATLTRRVREMEEEIQESGADWSESADFYRIRKWLGSPSRVQSAKLLLAMLKSPGRLLNHDALALAMDYGGEQLAQHSIAIVICWLRQSLKKHGLERAIVNVHGRGYYIEAKEAAVIRRLALP